MESNRRGSVDKVRVPSLRLRERTKKDVITMVYRTTCMQLNVVTNPRMLIDVLFGSTGRM